MHSSHVTQGKNANFGGCYPSNFWQIITDPSTSQEVLRGMVHDALPELLVRIAEHRNLAAHTLAQVANHPSVEVRCAVVDNPNTNLNTLWDLAHDSDPNVRYAIAENPRVDIAILQMLADDENAYVACRASQTLARINTESNLRSEVLQRIRRDYEKRSTTSKKPMKILSYECNLSGKSLAVSQIKDFLMRLGFQC